MAVKVRHSGLWACPRCGRRAYGSFWTLICCCAGTAVDAPGTAMLPAEDVTDCGWFRLRLRITWGIS